MLAEHRVSEAALLAGALANQAFFIDLRQWGGIERLGPIGICTNELRDPRAMRPKLSSSARPMSCMA